MPAPLPLTALPLRGAADAESLFLRLFADEPAAFWLDAGAGAAEGWSILGAGAVEDDPEAVRRMPLPAPRATSPAAHPVPFAGGWVGWLDYETGAARAGAPASAADGAAWIAVHRAVAIDHATGAAYALTDPASAHAWRDEVQTATAHGIPPAAAHGMPPAAAPAAPTTASARHDVSEYLDMIEQCRAAISRGDAYQLCLTTRFTAPRPADPLAAYRRLRTATPAHHGGYLRVGERMLLSASPEQFLSVSGAVVSTSPIKGTRPRGRDAADDARLAAELRADEKERAENVMIVDLMRNDLSRVGVPGTVAVPALFEVQSYPAVHQLVSTVTVRLRDGIRFGDLVDATFPAGSMTGAPKLSAMTLLHGLERASRGVYAGCFGHVGLDGRVDLAMVIRSIAIDSDAAHVGAGGGITWLSRPAAEAAEVATKARAPLEALGAALPPAWAGLGG